MTSEKKNLFYRLLDSVEYIGNKLPHPATLFALLALVVILSGLLEILQLTAKHHGTGEEIRTVCLLSGDGLRRVVSTIATGVVSSLVIAAFVRKK